MPPNDSSSRPRRRRRLTLGQFEQECRKLADAGGARRTLQADGGVRYDFPPTTRSAGGGQRTGRAARPSTNARKAGSRRSASSSSRSSSSPDDDGDPEPATGPGAPCHGGCGRTIPAGRRSDSRWCSEACRKKYRRNAPQQTGPQRDTRAPQTIAAAIEEAVSRRAEIWRSSVALASVVHATGRSAPQIRTELGDVEDVLNGDGGLWAEIRTARVARDVLGEHPERRLHGAPVEQRSAISGDAASGVGNRDGKGGRGRSSLSETASARRARLDREAQRSADEIEGWRRRKGFNVVALPVQGAQALGVAA